MRILIDIGHPAHVHYFKNFIRLMRTQGHDFFISARDKEMTHYLLRSLKIDFYNRGKGSASTFGKIIYMIKADFMLLKQAKKYKPDLLVSFGSPYAAHVSSLLGKPHIVFDDTENAKFGQMFYRPFSNHVLSPSCFKRDFGRKHIKYNSYIELCYLHPNYFNLDVSKLSNNNIDINEKYVIVRFVAWNANHDIGHKGISYENKLKVVTEFSKYAKVYISSEKELPPTLERYRLKINKESIHHILGFA
jgi:predicted glycosyltransferase